MGRGGGEPEPAAAGSKPPPPPPGRGGGCKWTQILSLSLWFLIHATAMVALLLGETEVKRDLDSSQGGHLHAIFYILLLASCGTLFLWTSLANPGWIDSPDHQKAKSDGLTPVPLKKEKPSIYAEDYPVDPSCRFCPACNLWQKLRSKHCNLCNRCVAKYDHHCFWMGNCIGEKNHGKFWWFLFLQTALIIWTLVLLIEGLCWSDLDNLEQFLEHNLLSVIVVIGTLVLGWLPMALLGLHSYLIFSNQTTWEFNRRPRITYLHGLPDGVHPFSKGCMGNVELVCCDFDPRPRYWRGVAEENGVAGF